MFHMFSRSQNCEKHLLASSCLSLFWSAWNNSAPMGWIFIKFNIWEFFENLSIKCKFHSNLTRIMGTVHGDHYTFLIISCSFLVRLRNASDKCCRGNQNTHFISCNFFGNPAVCEVMWKNIVEPERPQMTVWRIHISLCIPKATNTLSEYVLLFAFPLQQWLHECASMLRYMYFACLECIKIYNLQLKYFSFRFICI